METTFKISDDFEARKAVRLLNSHKAELETQTIDRAIKWQKNIISLLEAALYEYNIHINNESK